MESDHGKPPSTWRGGTCTGDLGCLVPVTACVLSSEVSNSSFIELTAGIFKHRFRSLKLALRHLVQTLKCPSVSIIYFNITAMTSIRLVVEFLHVTVTFGLKFQNFNLYVTHSRASDITMQVLRYLTVSYATIETGWRRNSVNHYQCQAAVHLSSESEIGRGGASTAPTPKSN